MEGVKEYLVKTQGGNWVFTTELTGDLGDEVIEVPKGADFMTSAHNYFWRDHPKKPYWFSEKGKWSKNSGQTLDNYLSESGCTIVWQRQEKPLEYLDPSDWSLKFIRGTDDAAPENWILVPEGADTLAGSADSQECRYFWNHVDDKIIGTGESLERYPYWMDAQKSTAPSWVKELDLPDMKILWQRHTLPDELPFIGDGPRLTAVPRELSNPHSDYVASEPPPYYHNAIRPKPRVRAYAVMGRRVISHIEIKIEVSA